MITNIITATITAYCSCKICVGGPNSLQNLTASGHKPQPNFTIAIPRKYSLNTTQVIIDGVTYIGQDRTARRFDGRFDIYMSSHQKALRFGKQVKQITIITK